MKKGAKNNEAGNMPDIGSTTIRRYGIGKLALAILLAVIVIAVPLTIYESDNVEGANVELNGIKYSTDSTGGIYTATITGFNNELLATVVIPATITHDSQTYDVIKIGDAFRNCSTVESLTIGKNIASLGGNAFNNMSKLKEVIVAEGNTKFTADKGVLFNADETTLILYPMAKEGSTYEIPATVTSIGGYALNGLKNLKEMNVAVGNTKFIDVNGVLFNIEKTTLRLYPIAKTDTTYTIPDGVTRIETNSFQHCANLTSVTMPNSVTEIGTTVFENCSNLTSVTIPENVTSINTNSFRNCTSLTSVTILSNKMTTITTGLFNNTGLTEITIPDSVKTIGNNAFYKCSGLTSVTIGSGVTAVGEQVFQDCTSLTSVTIGNNVETIGKSAFYNCSGLTSVTIPDSVTTINDKAFNGAGLTSLTIPATVTTVGADAFSNLKSLEEVIVADGNPLYVSEEDVLFNPDKTTLIMYPAAKADSTYIIPDTVTTVGDNAFQNCSALTSVTIGDAVITIGKSAFYNCSGLTSVTIGSGVTTVGETAFYGCSALTSVTIPDNVTNIGNNAFQYCSDLASVKIQSHIPALGTDVFKGCANLTTLTVELPSDAAGLPGCMISWTFAGKEFTTLIIDTEATMSIDDLTLIEGKTLEFTSRTVGTTGGGTFQNSGGDVSDGKRAGKQFTYSGTAWVQNESDDGDNNTMLYVAIAVIAIVALLGVVFFLKKSGKL